MRQTIRFRFFRITALRAAALCFAALCFAAPALAHKVNVYAYAEEGKIVGEGYFSGGGKAQNCPVALTDAAGAVLGQTQTDAAGKFSLALPDLSTLKPPLRLTLKAGDGHLNDFTLTAKDLGLDAKAALAQADAAPGSPAKAAQPPRIPADATPKPGASSSTAPTAASRPPATVTNAATAPAASPAALDQAALEALLAKVVERKLAPVNAQLAALAERADRVGFKEIMGGLGWIAGLFGLLAWLGSRKRAAGDPTRG